MFIKQSIAALTLIAGFSASTAMAAYAAVDIKGCSKLKGTTQPFILILKSGDNLHQGINQCAKNANLVGASIQGLGQLSDPTLAHYSSDPHEKPQINQFKGIYELISLNGNIARKNNEYYTHLHAVLGDEKYNGLAGHIKDSSIGVTAEITMIPFSKPLERNVDPETGFGPIVTE